MDHPTYYLHTRPKKCWGMRGCIEKKTPPTLTKDKTKIEYISGEQSSSYELVFGVELDPNSHSKKLSFVL